jgi:hypothetical protein
MLEKAMSNRTVYVFACSDPEFSGFSLDETGTNLPKLANTPNCPCIWTLVRAVPMSGHALRPFVRDVQVAVVNLNTRGYHIARNTAVVLDLVSLRPAT